MKWILDLMGKPGARQPLPTATPLAQAGEAPEDSESLRNALAHAVDGAERIQLAARLGRTLAAGGQAPCPEDAPEVWVAAICNAPDKALALAWSASLEDEAWLGEVAQEARVAEVRLACAQRIDDSAVLEQVARASRDKDRRVYRHCTDLLRQRRQDLERTEQVARIASQLRSLLEIVPLPHTPLQHVKQELGALEQAGVSSLECNALMQQALDRLHQEADARRELQARHDEAAALAAECTHVTWPWDEQLDSWRARLNRVKQARSALPVWLSGEATARALAQSMGEIETRLARLAFEVERNLDCERFLAALGSDLPADAAAAWEALAKPEHPDAWRALEARWQTLIAREAAAVSAAAQEALPKAKLQPRVDQAAMRALLRKLEQAVGEGHLADANATEQQIKAVLGDNSLHGALERRFHDLQAQLKAMRGWARWGAGQAREKLIAAASELLVGERDVEELAQAIPALREEWKLLNGQGVATGSQWEAFDGALEKAYQPVAAHRAAQAARHAEARAAREALCDTWEAELAGIAWEHADLKRVEARRSEMAKQWRAAPEAGFRDLRPLRRRFDALMAGIDARLEEARAAEGERRVQLITMAEALIAQPDLAKAMAEAKALQGRWNQQPRPVQLKRKDEEKLWKRFRAACNAVFERRDAQRAEQDVRRQEQARSRQLLLDTFAAALADADGEGIKHALAEFRADWTAARPSAHDASGSLEARATELQKEAQRRLDALRRDEHRSRFDQLAHRAALVERIEAAELAGGPIEAIVAEVRRIWDALPALPANVESLFVQRLAAAGAITHPILDEGRKTREGLLLELEIALGLPSPEGCAAARRERQLERLQRRFGGAAQESDPDALLARWYATAAFPDATHARRIEAIVRVVADQATPGSGASSHRKRA